MFVFLVKSKSAYYLFFNQFWIPQFWNLFNCVFSKIKHNIRVVHCKWVLRFLLVFNLNRYSAGIYLLKVNNRNNRTRFKICSKLIIKTAGRWQLPAGYKTLHREIQTLQSNFIEIALRDGCSPVNLLHIFRTPFSRNTSAWLLLELYVFEDKQNRTSKVNYNNKKHSKILLHKRLARVLISIFQDWVSLSAWIY